MGNFENGRVRLCMADGPSVILKEFSESLLAANFKVELCEEKELARADLICLVLSRRGIEVCKEITSDPFLLHTSIIFVADENITDALLIEAFDVGAIEIIEAPFSFGAVFAARFRSLVSLSRSRTELVHMASTDYLTNLFSRRYLFVKLKRVFLNHDAMNLDTVGCLMIDIDHLKVVNDSRGHHAGDEALVGVADLIRQTVRTDDVVARIGGDEIAVILLDIELQELVRLAERIRMLVDTEVPIVTTSIGLAITSFPVKCSVDNVDWFVDDLIVRADRALYNAKEDGRNRIALS